MQKKIEAVIAGLKVNIELEVKEYKVTTSMGIALRTETVNNFKSLYKSADMALYQTKKREKTDILYLKNKFVWVVLNLRLEYELDFM